METMNLQEFADRSVDRPSLESLSSRVEQMWSNLHRIFRNESQTDAALASILSELVLQTDEFNSLLEQRRLAPLNHSQREVILIKNSNWGEYILLVADDEYRTSTPESATLRMRKGSLSNSLLAWQMSLEKQFPETTL